MDELNACNYVLQHTQMAVKVLGQILKTIKESELKDELKEQYYVYKRLCDVAAHGLLKSGARPDALNKFEEQSLQFEKKALDFFGKDSAYLAKVLSDGASRSLEIIKKDLQNMGDLAYNAQISQEMISTQKKHIENLKRFM